MANERLKTALQQAGMQPDELANVLEVDTKTVRRWLYGNTPYPRHRTRISRALDTPEHELWPELEPDPDPAAPSPQPAPLLPVEPSGDPTANRSAGSPDVVGVWANHSDPEVPPFWPVLLAAQAQIDIYRNLEIQVTHFRQLEEILTTTQQHACPIRILLLGADPDRLTALRQDTSEEDRERNQILHRLLANPRVQIRHTVEWNWNIILRADHDMIASCWLYPNDLNHSPVLRLHRTTEDDLFDRFADHVNRRWETATPLQPPPVNPLAPPATPRRWPGRTN